MPNSAEVVHAATIAVSMVITPFLIFIITSLSKKALSPEMRDSFTSLIALAVGIGISYLALNYPAVFGVLGLATASVKMADMYHHDTKEKQALDVSRETMAVVAVDKQVSDGQ
jgi:uncharacterized membrane protein